MSDEEKKPVLALVQQHRAFPAPDDATVRAALELEGLTATRIVRCVVGERGERADEEPWARWQREQKRWAAAHLGDSALPLAYFGCTYIPLAVDLGRRAGSWRPVHVFQSNHDDKAWRLASEEGGLERQLHFTPIDRAPSERARELIISVGTSYAIREGDIHSPPQLAPLDDHPIRLLPPDPDATQFDGHLERVVKAYKGIQNGLCDAYPRARALHLLLCVPTGLAFRIGQEINETKEPPVYSWKFYSRVADGTHNYQRALRIGGTGTMRILFLAAQPTTTGRIRIDEEARKVAEQIRMGNYRDRVEVVFEQAVKKDDLVTYLDEYEPQVLHFAGHSAADGSLALEGVTGRTASVSPEAFALVIRTINEEPPRIRCIVLNSCWSSRLAEVLTKDGCVDVVIGWSAPADDPLALQFASGFYRHLSNGRSVGRAFRLARAGLQTRKAAKAFEVEIHPRDGVDPNDIVLTEEE